MKIRFFLLTVFICLCTASSLYSQSKQANVKDVTEIKNRQLIVLLKSEDDKIMGKLNDAKNIARYKADVKKLNDNIRSAVKYFWTFHKMVQFLTAKEVSQLKEPATSYAILSMDVINLKNIGDLTFRTIKQNSRLSIGFLEKFNPAKPVYYQEIVGAVTKEGCIVADLCDINFSVIAVQNHLEDRLAGKDRRIYTIEATENSGLLKDKILLVDSDCCDPSSSEKEIFKDYPFKYKVCSPDEIATVQQKRDKRFAYVTFIPISKSENGLCYHVIMDCERAKAISFSFRTPFIQSNWVNPKRLKDYVKYSEYNTKKEE